MTMQSNIPHHVAIIMDGNGRWAQQRDLPRLAGHRAGSDRVKEIVRAADRLGIRVLTFYAFSEENWNRPIDEVNGLMLLIRDYLVHEQQSILENNVRFQIFGDIERLPSAIREVVQQTIDLSMHNTGLVLNFAVSYGGRQEILRAVNQLLVEVESGTRSCDRSVTLEEFGDRLYTRGLPDPDLIIRTSGEKRISNFLLWQLAYSELYITDTLWPDFTPAHLEVALAEFDKRNRRFGRTAEQLEEPVGDSVERDGLH
ncbi:MAG: isoprenyl transferase [Myxococcales bacterium]|nr:isoprenyl transferase [Myxococcales bacterium]